MKQVKYSQDSYNELSAYVLANIDPVKMDRVEECYRKINPAEIYSIEYCCGGMPLTDKIEDLIEKWFVENDIDRDYYLVPALDVEGAWRYKNVEGSFFNLVFRLFMDVCKAKGIK